MADRAHGRRRPRRKGRAASDGERRQLAHAARHPATPPSAPAPGDWARLLCDGGSRGNPGPAAIAAVLLAPGGAVLDTRSELIGRATAAEAEYRAIRFGLELASGAPEIEVRSDSQLAISRLLVGEGPEDVLDAARAFRDVRWVWHPRAANEAADALVRELLWPI